MTTRVDVKSKFDEFMPKRAHANDAGADLFALYSTRIDPCKTETIDTGVCVDIPEGFVGLLFSRSGHGKVGLRLANCVGVIDSGYQGEIKVMVRNDSLSAYYDIKSGDRIAQLVLIPCITPTFRLVNQFADESARGDKGFGSTG